MSDLQGERTTLPSTADVEFELDGEGTYLAVHAANPDLLVAPPEVIIGNKISDFLEPEASEVGMRGIRLALQSGMPQWVEYSVTSPEGQKNWFIALISPRGPDLVSAVVRDVSNSLLISQRLEQALATAEQASADKSRFIAAASHDLRQPLQSAQLFLDVLRMRLAGSDKLELAERVASSLNSTAELLNDLLEISRLETGVQQLVEQEFLLAEVMQEIFDDLQPLAEAKRLKFRVHHCGYRLRTDKVMFKAVLRNLVANAVAYTFLGGVLLACRRRGDHVRIEVWDTGIGIPADQQGAIFEDFVQLGNPERDRSKGTGLGLAIVRRLSQALGIEYGLRSNPGRGSVFFLELPISGRL